MDDTTVVAVSVSLPRLYIWSERKVDAYNFPGEWMDGWAGFKKGFGEIKKKKKKYMIAGCSGCRSEDFVLCFGCG